ncbi:hypothetical protein BH18ACT6_BH18ACT6_13000 [soil metagenome]
MGNEAPDAYVQLRVAPLYFDVVGQHFDNRLV